MNWTKPFYGVSHLDGLKKGFQVTIADHGSKFVEAYMLVPNHGFSAIAETTSTTVEEAKAWGEETARKWHAVAEPA